MDYSRAARASATGHCAAVVHPSFGVSLNVFGLGRITDPLTLGADLTLIQTFLPSTINTGLAAAWSLSAELVFYLALPVFVVLVAWLIYRKRLHPTAAAAVPPLALLVLCTVLKVIAAATEHGGRDIWGPTWHAVFERSFFVQGDLFAYGMLVAVALVHTGGSRERLPLSLRRPGLLAAAVGLIAVLLQASGRFDGRTYDSLVASAFALLLLHVVVDRPGGHFARRTLELRPVVYVGLISYSVYLWHLPVIYWMRRHDLMTTGTVGGLRNVGIALALTGIASALTYRFVETPALRRKRRAPDALMRRDAGLTEAAP